MSTAHQVYNFEDIKDELSQAVHDIFPVAITRNGQEHRLELEDVIVKDDKDENDLDDQYKALAAGKDWAVPVRAKLALHEPDGSVKRSTVTLFNLPRLTPRQTFIVGGKEHQITSILRRRHGVYNIRNRKDELIGEFNIRGGLQPVNKYRDKAPKNFRIHFDPQDSRYYLRLTGQEKIPAFDLLNILGYDTRSLQKDLGEKVYLANSGRSSAAVAETARKIHEKVYGKADTAKKDRETIVSDLIGTFERPLMDAEVNKYTLGVEAERLSPDLIARSMSRLLRISRGQETEDDRESLAFKQLVFPSQNIAEALSHPKSLKSIRDQIAYRMNSAYSKVYRAERSKKKGETSEKDTEVRISNIVPTRFLEDRVVGRMSKSNSDAETVAYSNPVGLVSGHNKVSMIGSGGLSSDRSASLDAPLLSPSHLGFVSPTHTPESERIGLTLHLSSGSRLDGKRLRTRVLSPDGKSHLVSPGEASYSTVAFPDEYEMVDGVPKPVGRKVRAQRRGQIEEVDPKDVDYILPKGSHLFDTSSLTVPFLLSNQGNRAAMASKHVTQALSLKERDEPLVQTGVERELGKGAGAQFSPVDGKVTDVRSVSGAYVVTIQDEKGKEHKVKAYRNFPLGTSHSVLDSEIHVKAGDDVKAGQVVADSTFTKNGVLSMGRNLRVAYMPWKGLNTDDGIVVSQQAADKLTSVNMHEEAFEPTGDTVLKRDLFYREFPGSAPKDQILSLDPTGVIKKGAVVTQGQLLLGALRRIDPTTDQRTDRMLTRLGVKPGRRYEKQELRWERDVPGVVTDVVKQDDGSVKILIKTEEPIRVGDKLVNRHAAKGIVTEILPTEQMPHTKDGHPVDIILDPTGVPGRMNVGQVLEVAGGKIAEKTGRTFNASVEADLKGSTIRRIVDGLKKHGLDSEEELIDPTRGNRSYGKVLVGPQYVYKLKHQVADKERSRGIRGGYDAWDIPIRGSGGAQSIGEFGLYGLLAHGALENVRDMQLYKSQKYPRETRGRTLWQAIRDGGDLPLPPHITPNKRFESLLRVAGVNLDKGDWMGLTPQTDADTERLAGSRRVKDPGLMFVLSERKGGGKGSEKAEKDIGSRVLPEKGGLFDEKATGGERGELWSYYRLAEPIPNPLFEPAIRSLLGLDAKRYSAIVQGKEEYKGAVGGAAIKGMLADIDLDARENQILEDIKTVQDRPRKSPEKKAEELHKLYAPLRYVRALKERGQRPEDVYVVQNMPILPPRMRPVVAVSNRALSADSLNHLYRDIALVDQTLKGAKESNLSVEEQNKLRAALYDGMGALLQVGGHKPLSGSYRGALGIIIGKSPSEREGGADEGKSSSGLFQDQIVRRRQNFSGRTTITPEPRLRLDQVGLPYSVAYDIYAPWAIKALARRERISTTKAQKYYEDEGHKNGRVRRALQEATGERPLIFKRDPVLHKHGVMGARPVLVEGNTLQIHPLHAGGFGADFDGDEMSVYVPVHPNAVAEVEKLMPSRNIFSPATGKIMYSPGPEAVLGIWHMTHVGNKTDKSFDSYESAKRAYVRNEIKATDQIQIDGKPTTYGWDTLNKVLPEPYRQTGSLTGRAPVSKKRLSSMLTSVARDHGDLFPATVDNIKDLGNQYATENGLSLKLSDFEVVNQGFRDKLFADADKRIAHGADTVETYKKVILDLDKKNLDTLRTLPQRNHVFDMVDSGARAEYGQLKQIMSSPVLVYDPKNNVVPLPIKHSYSEGLSTSEYWATMFGARKGSVDKQLETRRPGYLGKQIIRTAIDQVVTIEDCGTKNGIPLPINDPDIAGRFLAQQVKVDRGGRGSTAQRNSLLTGELISGLASKGVKQVMVRSPLTCEAKDGLCAKCAGLNERGTLPKKGDNLGVVASQSISEPSTQLSMKTFHTGAIVDPSSPPATGRFEAVRNLLTMPAPEKMPDRAVLSPATGYVQRVEKADQGGLNVFLSPRNPRLAGTGRTGHRKLKGDDKDLRHVYLDPEQSKRVLRSVRTGSPVKKGDQLTAGLRSPSEVFELKGLPAAQEALVSQLHGLFADSGKPINRRHFEVIARGLSKFTRILDPKDSEWTPGQFAPSSQVLAYNQGKPERDRVRHVPHFGGVEGIMRHDEDWVARLNTERMRDVIINTAGMNLKSRTHGTNPIPPVTFLSEERLSEMTGFGRPSPNALAGY